MEYLQLLLLPFLFSAYMFWFTKYEFWTLKISFRAAVPSVVIFIYNVKTIIIVIFNMLNI